MAAPTLRELAEEAAACTRCDLCRRATATVFGEGRAGASLVLVGEHRGRPEDGSLGSWHGLVVSTIHPSAVLRAPGQAARKSAYAGYVGDLAAAGRAAARSA